MQEGEGSRAGAAHTRVCCVVCALTHVAVQACGCACARVLRGVHAPLPALRWRP